ncbi:MAG TPA: phosphatidate cytidylyltransferase, partial [Flavobacteriales bacterium]|nr:phosphatidate cytidylyltransferase [Flavobacteriales bacterium]
IALAALGYTTTVVLLLVPHLAPAFIVGLGLCFLLVLFLLLRSGTSRPAEAFASHLSTVLYIALPMAAAVFLVMQGTMILIGFMCLLWTNDTGAYLVGKPLGKHKLMPLVSPGKSWEGLIGGVVLTMGVAWFIGTHHHELSLKAWLIAGFAISISATVGDLFESAMKRAAGVKDSGSIMPGHGGVLDRFDGYLFAAPVMVVIALMMR